MPPDSEHARSLVMPIYHATHEIQNVQADKMLSDIGKAEKVKPLINKLKQAVERCEADSQAALASYENNLYQNQLQSAKLRPGGLDSEIRTAFRGLPISEKMKVLANSVESNDSLTASALLLDGVPAWLTGLNAEQIQTFKKAFVTKNSGITDNGWAHEAYGISKSFAATARKLLPVEIPKK